MSGLPTLRYVRFAEALTRARQVAGLQRQADLAELLSVKQQTISRWEAGTHRPSEKQLPPLAAALKLNLSELRVLLGDDQIAGQSFTRALPLQTLAPETFEQFVADLVQAEQPQAQVRRAGKTGHKQDGIDIQLTSEAGDVTDIQCKRVETFGESKVKAAVSAYIGGAQRRIIALSRVASPAASTAARAAGWEMWDQDDLSRRLRRLPNEQQDRLVDIYFYGQRRELLGRDEPGPWRSIEEFFLPFTAKPVFNHDIPLIGRDKELEDISNKIRSIKFPLTIISAPGGMGKSRILKNALEQIQALEKNCTIRFLSSSADASRGDLESLGAGPKILVIDDAHDRSSLASIFEFASDPSRQARLVIATRPYGLDRIKGESSRFGLSSAQVVKLAALSNSQINAITTYALEKAGAEKYWTAPIVQMAGKSPLISTMAARVIANQRIVPELAKKDDEFRTLILGRFTDVLSANIDTRDSKDCIRKLLDIIALVQPFDPKSRQFIELAQAFGLTEDDVSRCVRLLSEGGVLLERRAEWRLMPDVLGDYLIERICVDVDGHLSSFALNIIDHVISSNMLGNVLLNLGRMDWRINDGDTGASVFLSQIWQKFSDISHEHDSRLDAIKLISIYQPRSTIDFIAQAIRRGHRFAAFAEMLRGVFYSGQERDASLEILWELGRNDPRETGPNPLHPIRVLTEIGDYAPEQSLDVTKSLFEFAVKISTCEDNWKGKYTPLDLIKPALETEGHTTRSSPRKMQLIPFQVSYSAVSILRKSAVDFIIRLISNENSLIAAKAAAFIRNALQVPRGIFGLEPDKELIKKLNLEFETTLKEIKSAVHNGVSVEAFISIFKSVDWLANYGADPLKSMALEIQEIEQSDPEFELIFALLNGHGGRLIQKNKIDTWQDDLNSELEGMASRFRLQHETTEERVSALNNAIRRIVNSGESINLANASVVSILKNDQKLSEAIISSALAGSEAAVEKFAVQALWELFDIDRAKAHKYARDCLSSTDTRLHRTAAIAFHKADDAMDADDSELLDSLLIHTDPSVVIAALRVLRFDQSLSRSARFDLLFKISVADDSSVIDELCLFFVPIGGNNIVIDTDLAVRILDKIESVPRLEGHWIDMLLAKLSKEHAAETLEFFIRRVESASSEGSFRIRPVNHGPYANEKLKFNESFDATKVFRRAWSWMKDGSDKGIYFREMSGNLFEAMLSKDESSIVALFQPLIGTASFGDIETITSLIRHLHHGFIFRNSSFVISLLTRSSQLGADAHQASTEQLFAAAVSGGRSGTPGEPMPRDVADERKSAEMLAKLSRISPAYELFYQINRSAKRAIARSQEEGRRMDEIELDEE